MLKEDQLRALPETKSTKTEMNAQNELGGKNEMGSNPDKSPQNGCSLRYGHEK